tara:strand:- start:18247 stop:19452 length:1206 start_codon:yes stop_codon:yes gene_type:complete
MNIDFLKEAFQKYGTPLYIYDFGIIRGQYTKLKKAFKNVRNFKIHFAVKSLSNISVLKFMKSLGAGLDTVSIEEVKIGIKCGFDPQEITFTPNGVSIIEIDEACKLKVNINLDSIESIYEFSEKYSSYPISLRINPNIMAGGNKNTSVGHSRSKFGIPFENIEEILEMENENKINIIGIHIHTGSDIVKLDEFKLSFKKVFSIAKKFKQVKRLNFGGGLKIKYFNEDTETDINQLSNLIQSLINQNSFVLDNDVKIIFEPGKYLVGESGFFLAKVNHVKQSQEINFVQINTGFNHLLRPTLYGSYHEIINLSNLKGKKYDYNVVGYICEEDTFAYDRKISKIKKGDVLCFRNAGAYCFSMSSNYNSRIKPAEICIFENKLFIIRHEEKLDDLLNGQIDIFE